MNEWLLLAASLLLVGACGDFVAAEFALCHRRPVLVERAAEPATASHGGLAWRSEPCPPSCPAPSSASPSPTCDRIPGRTGDRRRSRAAGVGRVQRRRGPPVSVAIGLTVATVLTMVFGELVPKNLAIASPIEHRPGDSAVSRLHAGLGRADSLLNGSPTSLSALSGSSRPEELAQRPAPRRSWPRSSAARASRARSARRPRG